MDFFVHFIICAAGFIGAPDRAGPITVRQVAHEEGGGEQGAPETFVFEVDDPKKATFRHLTLRPPCMLW